MKSSISRHETPVLVVAAQETIESFGEAPGIHALPQAAFDLGDQRCRYARSVPYDQPPVLAALDGDIDWIAERVPAISTGE